MKRLLACLALLLAFAANTAAAQNTYTAYINSDSNAATGCTIVLPGGTFSGADWRVQATLTPGAAPTVTSVTLTPCSGGTFGAGSSIGGGSVDLNTGVSGSDSIEFSAPGTGILTGASQALTLGFTAQSATGSDVMFTSNGLPIVFGITVPVPALGAGALTLLALLVMAMARRFGRTRWYQRMVALSMVAMCGVALAAAFNWTGIPPIATDPAGDATNGSADIDLRAGFFAINANTLYFRIDVSDLQTQAPQITSANATTFIVGQAGTFTVTSTGVPSAALALSGCTLPAGVTFVDNGNGTGTLAGTPGSGTANTYACTLTASNGILPNATQAFTLTVANAPSQTALGVDINPSVFGQSVTFTATVTPAPPGSGTPTGTVNFLDAATPIGSGTLAGGVATFATGTLSVATHPITAQYVGDPNFGPSTSNAVSQVVNQASQTITFTSTAPAGATVGGPTYTATATASSGLAVALTVDASAASVCSIAGSTVSFTGVGTCVIDANQAGNANYTAAPQVQQSFAVGKGSQTITFTSTAPAGATVGGPTYTVTATASSGLAVTLTIDASAASVCSIAGSTVSFSGFGTCVIDANQAGNANYNAAPQAQQSFAVGKGSQTITFTSTAPASAVVGGATYTVTATATSGLAVTFTIDATATSVCSLAGSTVSFIGAGTCVIDANQAGDANWNAAPQAAQSFAVGKNNQTITFTSTAPAGAVVAGPTYTVTATATSGLAVTFTIDATATSVCSIAGSTVSFIGAGTCVIDANQAGNANYNAAPQMAQSFAVGKGTQTISFTSTAPAGAAVGGPTYTVTATATSGLPVTLTIDASAASVCSIAGSTVSFIGAGTCVIDANQAGNANYNAAAQAQQSFAVAKGNQTISFTSTAPASAQFNGPTYTVTATATSGLAVTFTIDATATSVCSIAGSTVSFIGVGTCVIDANQAGNANYNAAPLAQQSFAVAKADQTISFTSTPPVSALVSGPTYTVTATATSGLTVTFTIDATATSVCSIAGSTVSFIGGGTCVIDANQAGNANYNAAPQVSQSFVVNKNNQTITFTSTAPATAKNGGATYTVSATATSGLTVTFSSATPGVCTVATNVVTFVGAGTCTINADQAGNAAYNPAPQMQQSFLVAKGDQTIAFTSTLAAFVATGSTYNAAATASSGLAVVFSTDASSTSGCSAAGNVVTFNAPVGTCVIDANQPGDANWNPAPQVQQSTTVEDPASAVNDSHAVTGNVAIAAGTSVMSNDSGTAIAIRSYGATGTEQSSIGSATPTVQGGSVTLVAAGTYNYDPPANFTGTDTFKYVIGNDLATTSTGTVTLTVSDRIMVVATSGVGAADCKPQSACVLATADGKTAVTAGKDLVFVESGSYGSATFSLLANQDIAGQAVDLSTALTDAGITLATESVTAPIAALAASTTPTFNNAGNVITLGGGNLVEYFSITNTSGAAILGNAAGSGTSSIHDIAVTDSGNAGNGVNITANLGTLNFSNIAVATSTGNAFAATGGGTINVTTGSGANTLASTTGTALNVTNTTIGASGMTFQSISAGTAASGPANGIVLNNTGSSGGLTVAGTGSSGSGGTIQKTSAAGILLTNTSNVNLSWMNVQSSAHEGIKGTNVNGFALANASITANGSTDTTNDNGVRLIDTSGAVSFNGVNVSGSIAHNVFLSATPTSTAAMSSLNVTNGSFNSSVNGDGFLVSLSNTASIATGTISGAMFDSNAAMALNLVANDNAVIGNSVGVAPVGAVTVTGCTMTNSGGVGVSFASGGGNAASNMYVRFVNNTLTGTHSHAINVVSGATSTGGAQKVLIDNNRIGTAGVPTSGSQIGEGIVVTQQGRTTQTVTITNNVIRALDNAASGPSSFDARGIDVQALGPTGTGLPATTANYTIVNNDIDQQYTGSALNIQYAIYVGVDDQGSPTNVAAAIHGNKVPSTNPCDTQCGPPQGMIEYEQVTSPSAGTLFNFSGSGASVSSEIANTNTGTSGQVCSPNTGLSLVGAAPPVVL